METPSVQNLDCHQPAPRSRKKTTEKHDLALPGSLTSEILVMQKKNPDTLQHTDCEKWNRRPSCYGTRICSCIQLLFFCSAKTDNLFFLYRKTAHRKTVDGLFYFYTHALLKTVHSQQLLILDKPSSCTLVGGGEMLISSVSLEFEACDPR